MIGKGQVGDECSRRCLSCPPRIHVKVTLPPVRLQYGQAWKVRNTASGEVFCLKRIPMSRHERDTSDLALREAKLLSSEAGMRRLGSVSAGEWPLHRFPPLFALPHSARSPVRRALHRELLPRGRPLHRDRVLRLRRPLLRNQGAQGIGLVPAREGCPRNLRSDRAGTCPRPLQAHSAQV